MKSIFPSAPVKPPVKIQLDASFAKTITPFMELYVRGRAMDEADRANAHKLQASGCPVNCVTVIHGKRVARLQTISTLRASVMSTDGTSNEQIWPS